MLSVLPLKDFIIIVRLWAAARRLLADPACWALGALAMCGALPLGLLLASSLIDADGRPSFEHYHHVLASAAAWRSC